MRSVLHSVLAIVITLVYGVGSSLTVEFEHSHLADGHHDHKHVDAGSGHEHHSNDPAPSPGDSEDGDPDGDPHQHSHVVSLGTDSPSTVPSLPELQPLSWTILKSPLPDSAPCPDGPRFPLIKPLQLG